VWKIWTTISLISQKYLLWVQGCLHFFVIVLLIQVDLMGIGLGFGGGIYLSRRGAFTRFQRTIVIFISSLTGEFIGRKVGEVRSQDTFNQLVPHSPIHKMTAK
jgi:hypothetical protein